MKTKIKQYTKYYVYIVLAISALLVWQHFANNSNKVKILLSSPMRISNYFYLNYIDLLHATGITMFESLVGLLFATLFSFAVMILCFYLPKIMDYVLPIMISSQVIPLITLAPLFILIFGIGYSSKIMMAALMCFFPIFVNFANGVKLISKNIHEMLFVYNVSKTQRIFRVYFPLSLPYIMTGLKIAATLSVIGAIVAEFNGTDIGLGKNLFLAAKRLEPELMMCSLILSSLLGAFMYLIIYIIEINYGVWYLKKKNS